MIDYLKINDYVIRQSHPTDKRGVNYHLNQDLYGKYIVHKGIQLNIH